MVRVPGSINSKNGEQVKIIQEWDGHRPSIALMIGSFQLWLSTKQKKEAAKFAKIANSKIGQALEICRSEKLNGSKCSLRHL